MRRLNCSVKIIYKARNVPRTKRFTTKYFSNTRGRSLSKELICECTKFYLFDSTCNSLLGAEMGRFVMEKHRLDLIFSNDFYNNFHRVILLNWQRSNLILMTIFVIKFNRLLPNEKKNKYKLRESHIAKLLK